MLIIKTTKDAKKIMKKKNTKYRVSLMPKYGIHFTILY